MPSKKNEQKKKKQITSDRVLSNRRKKNRYEISVDALPTRICRIIATLTRTIIPKRSPSSSSSSCHFDVSVYRARSPSTYSWCGSVWTNLEIVWLAIWAQLMNNLNKLAPLKYLALIDPDRKKIYTTQHTTHTHTAIDHSLGSIRENIQCDFEHQIYAHSMLMRAPDQTQSTR